MAEKEVSVAPYSKLCPSCGRKGLHYPMHPDAYGWKDIFGAMECRFCRKRFPVEFGAAKGGEG